MEFPRVFCNVLAYVSCRGYVCIPQSAQPGLRIKVAPRISFLFVLDRKTVEGDFFILQKEVTAMILLTKRW